VADFLAIMLQKKPVFLGTSRKLRHQIAQGLQETESGHLIDRLVGSLSGGELRRVLLAQALIPTPEFLILDEPASNIDELGARAFEQTLLNLRGNKKMAILMVAHDLSTMLRIADQVTGINGRISYSGPASSLREPEVLKKIFGVQAYSLGERQEVLG
jgi:zinc transport system ATP-binding protein